MTSLRTIVAAGCWKSIKVMAFATSVRPGRGRHNGKEMPKTKEKLELTEKFGAYRGAQRWINCTKF